MKLKIFTLIALSFILLSNRGGRNQPSVAAPGDGPATCAQCHGGGNFDTGVIINLKDGEGNNVENYTPGNTYTLEVVGSVASGQNAAGYGFQMVVLDTTNNNQAGEFISYGDNVRNNVVQQRNYVMQSSPRADGVFTAEWKAPDANTGAINIYVSMLAINGNSNTNGDRVINTSFQFGEGVVSDIQEVAVTEITAFPNPTQGLIYLNKDYENVQIFDLMGRQVIKNSGISNQIDLSALQSGTYIIRAEGQETQRIVKL